MRVTDDERRVLATWSADCAERVLPLFEAREPSDPRPRAAIHAARTFGSGEVRTRPSRRLAIAAHAAAREVGDPAAAAAARAAGLAAATPFIHDDPETIGSTGHAVGAAAYAALARERAAGGDPGAADAEVRWAVGHASAAVLAAVRRLPAFGSRRGRRDQLMQEIDAAIRR
jgi:hypothetical protein